VVDENLCVPAPHEHGIGFSIDPAVWLPRVSVTVPLFWTVILVATVVARAVLNWAFWIAPAAWSGRAWGVDAAPPRQAADLARENQPGQRAGDGACSKPAASPEPGPRLAADPGAVRQRPEQQPAPEPDEAGGRTQEFPAYPGQSAGGWAGGQSYAHVPPPPAVGPWADEPSGGGGYQPTARDLAWPRRRHPRRPWLIVGSAAALVVAAAIGGFVGHAVGSKTVAASSPSGSGRPSTLPGNGSGAGSGSGAGNPFGGTGNGSGTGNGFGGGFSGPFGGSGPSGNGQSSQGSGPSDAASIAARVDPGLVDVNTTVDYGADQAAGTGMVLTPGGEVLTNNHVIEGATTISVTDVGNGKTYSATVVGYSVTKDAAVLQLTGASGLQTVTTAGSAPVPAGEEVVGIGNAGGAGGTPSYAGGTVTATGQTITPSDELTGTSETLTGMIETSADIQAGDSGGPLVDAAGQVIGMDTAGSENSESGGTGFAIPIGTATSIAAQITAGHATGTVHIGPTAFLGVQIEQASAGGSGPGYGYGGPAPASGVQIAGVLSGSPAAGSGLAAGDVITAVASHSVSSQATLQTVMVNDVRPGEQVTIQYTDTTGQQRSVSLVLTSGPPA
jgi:S1-C subfamily serine protease